MATGTAGSSFTSELNRLANSGTYPALTAYLAPVGAANQYAGTYITWYHHQTATDDLISLKGITSGTCTSTNGGYYIVDTYRC